MLCSLAAVRIPPPPLRNRRVMNKDNPATRANGVNQLEKRIDHPTADVHVVLLEGCQGHLVFDACLFEQAPCPLISAILSGPIPTLRTDSPTAADLNSLSDLFVHIGKAPQGEQPLPCGAGCRVQLDQ